MDRELLQKKKVIATHIDSLLSQSYLPQVATYISGVKKWLETEAEYQLFFFGGKGTGKSFVAEVAMVEALKKNIPARRVVWGELIADIQDNYGQVGSKYHYDKLLFIDNFKRIDNKAYHTGLSFLKSQHEEGKRLIISMTSLDSSDIPQDFRDAMGAVCMVVNFKGECLTQGNLVASKNALFGRD